MYCSIQSNNLVNRVHERSVRLTYRDEINKEFQQILRGKNEPTVYQKNLQVLMTEVYKIVNGIAAPKINFALTSIKSETLRKSLQRIGKL